MKTSLINCPLNDAKKLIPAVKSGRAWNGAHKDAGTIVHAVEPLPPTIAGDWFTKAECGAKPGSKSNGWAKTNREINCPICYLKCLKIWQINLSQIADGGDFNHKT